MRVIAHVSDLHFNRVDRVVAEALVHDLHARKPSLTVISGDLTQRALHRQFRAARAYLDRLPRPQIVVPGNHDIPLHNPLVRYLMPLARYQKHITEDLAPCHMDDEIAVVGLNTARASLWTAGRIALEQIAHVRNLFCALPQHIFKVMVTHHPFIPPPEWPKKTVVGRALQTLVALELCGMELLLAGHLHLGYTGDARAFWTPVKKSILVVQAGTAISTRKRGEPNNYNVITIDLPNVVFELRAWDGKEFVPVKVTRYVKVANDWNRVEV